MVQPMPHADELDSFLREVVQTIHEATQQGMRNLQDNPAATDRALADCQEIIGQIMEGDVKGWLA